MDTQIKAKYPNIKVKLTGKDGNIGRLPKTRLDYWQPKIAANRERDARKQAALVEAGWRVAVVWQCELADVDGLSSRLDVLLDISDRYFDRN
jgi:DNA mismatch endonuclease, patch repair protein